MKLHLGCGPVHIPGWVNIDYDAREEPDVVADVRSLPYEDASAEAVYASHVLEHFAHEEPVLEEWHRVLVPGGIIVLVVPDLVGVVRSWRRGGVWGSDDRPIELDYVNATAFGGNLLGLERFSGDGHVHRQIFIEDMLVERMREFFPDAHQIPSVTFGPGLVQRCSQGETMAAGTKPERSGDG